MADEITQSDNQGQGSPSAARFCPECGTSVKPDSRYCGECGYDLVEKKSFKEKKIESEGEADVAEGVRLVNKSSAPTKAAPKDYSQMSSKELIDSFQSRQDSIRQTKALRESTGELGLGKVMDDMSADGQKLAAELRKRGIDANLEMSRRVRRQGSAAEAQAQQKTVAPGAESKSVPEIQTAAVNKAETVQPEKQDQQTKPSPAVSSDEADRQGALAMLENIKRAKRGEALKKIDTAGMSPEMAKDVTDMQAGQAELATLKQAKAAKTGGVASTAATVAGVAGAMLTKSEPEAASVPLTAASVSRASQSVAQSKAASQPSVPQFVQQPKASAAPSQQFAKPAAQPAVAQSQKLSAQSQTESQSSPQASQPASAVSSDEADRQGALAMLENIKRAKRGEALKKIDTAGMSPEMAKDVTDMQAGQAELATLKQAKAAKTGGVASTAATVAGVAGAMLTKSEPEEAPAKLTAASVSRASQSDGEKPAPAVQAAAEPGSGYSDTPAVQKAASVESLKQKKLDETNITRISPQQSASVSHRADEPAVQTMPGQGGQQPAAAQDRFHAGTSQSVSGAKEPRTLSARLKAEAAAGAATSAVAGAAVATGAGTITAGSKTGGAIKSAAKVAVGIAGAVLSKDKSEEQAPAIGGVEQSRSGQPDAGQSVRAAALGGTAAVEDSETAPETVAESGQPKAGGELKTAAELAMTGTAAGKTVPASAAAGSATGAAVESDAVVGEAQDDLQTRNAREMKKYFGENETTTVKNYDAQGNEILDTEPAKTEQQGGLKTAAELAMEKTAGYAPAAGAVSAGSRGGLKSAVELAMERTAGSGRSSAVQGGGVIYQQEPVSETDLDRGYAQTVRTESGGFVPDSGISQGGGEIGAGGFPAMPGAAIPAGLAGAPSLGLGGGSMGQKSAEEVIRQFRSRGGKPGPGQFDPTRKMDMSLVDSLGRDTKDAAPRMARPAGTDGIRSEGQPDSGRPVGEFPGEGVEPEAGDGGHEPEVDQPLETVPEAVPDDQEKADALARARQLSDRIERMGASVDRANQLASRYAGQGGVGGRSSSAMIKPVSGGARPVGKMDFEKIGTQLGRMASDNLSEENAERLRKARESAELAKETSVGVKRIIKGNKVLAPLAAARLGLLYRKAMESHNNFAWAVVFIVQLVLDVIDMFDAILLGNLGLVITIPLKLIVIARIFMIFSMMGKGLWKKRIKVWATRTIVCYILDFIPILAFVPTPSIAIALMWRDSAKEAELCEHKMFKLKEISPRLAKEAEEDPLIFDDEESSISGDEDNVEEMEKVVGISVAA